MDTHTPPDRRDRDREMFPTKGPGLRVDEEARNSRKSLKSEERIEVSGGGDTHHDAERRRGKADPLGRGDAVVGWVGQTSGKIRNGTRLFPRRGAAAATSGVHSCFCSRDSVQGEYHRERSFHLDFPPHMSTPTLGSESIPR